ncbi:MAG: VOC family protein [Gammaproteobacteria bacterium]
MQLNHIDLPVPDVVAATRFFVDGFGFSILEQRGRDGMAILSGPGMVLVLAHAPDAVYPPTFHIGFLQDSAQAVHDAWRHLQACGVDAPAPKVMRGSLLFYCRAPGGVLVEVSYRGPLPRPEAA